MAASAQRLGAAMSAPFTARLLELLGQVAAELDAELPRGRVELRLLGQDAELVYLEDEEPPDDLDADASARITLRLPEQLKTRIDAAAAREGISVNAYIVRALGQRSRPDRGVAAGRRLKGYGRS